MKKILIAAFIVCSISNFAQVKTPQPSPKATISQVVGLTEVNVEYSRPGAKGRIIFGDLVPFGKIWRTGANENTTISFSEDITIDGRTLKSGKYALYTNPKADSWEIIFYTDITNWGTPKVWDDAKVALRTVVKPFLSEKKVESFTISLNNLESGAAILELLWDKTVVDMKFEVPTQKATLASIEKVLAGPSASDYFSAAQYYYQSNLDLPKTLEFINKAVSSFVPNTDNPSPFWMLRLKSLVQAKMNDKKGAVETAKLSLAGATAIKNEDYIKMNNDSIREWTK